jgi:hypothetical protein
VARYGNYDDVVSELTRISKPGAVLRVTQDRGIYGSPNFSDRLAKAGWDVYIPRSFTGSVTNVVAARLQK